MKDKKPKYNIDPKILAQYEDGDTVWYANAQDNDLDTIPVPLPPTPAWDTIVNYGLPAKDQYWHPPKIPAKLIAIEEEMDDNGLHLNHEEIWDRINSEKQYYKEEIEFIKREWHRRLFGVWYFINGKATYIPAWAYLYLSYWQLPEGLPDFRQRDLRFFWFAEFCHKDPKCFGFIDIKHRRAGSTSKASCINFAIASVAFRGRTGIQSMTEKSAEDVFQKHIVPGWRGMPFYLKPSSSNSDDPKKALLFSSPATKGKIGVKKRSGKSLMTDIGYRSSGAKAFDGTALLFSHDDEAGKTVEVNINDRWRCKKMCLSRGSGSKIIGLELMTSTVGETESGGGQALKELCDNSKYSLRNKNGQTASGLYVLFIPCEDGLEGFVGPYGESVIEKPTPQQAKFIDKDYGAREYIDNTIAHLKAIGDKDALADYYREHPQSFKSAFRTNGRDSFFDIPKIEERLDELAEMVTGTSQGNFEWEGPKFRSRVRFVPDPDKGKFKVSLVLPPEKSNMVSWDARIESYIALNDTKYSAGADPFKSRKTKAKTNSKGGGAVYWGHDITLDPFEKPMDKWESCRLLCTYLHRPDDKDEFSEDMIMMCLYYGCPMYAETNVQDLVDDFTDWGFSGMLIHKYNTVKDKVEELPGQATGEKTHQEIFKLIQRHIKYHCHRERHADFLEQVRDIQSTEEMTKYDLFSAVGYAMLGFQQFGAHVQRFTKPDSSQDLTDFIPEYSY